MDENETNSVTLKIINSKRYTRLRPIRYSIYIICFLLFYIPIRPLGRPSVTDYLGINRTLVYGVLIALIIIAIILYRYSKNYEWHGNLTLDSDHVTISLFNLEPLSFSIPELKNFKISRGSTVHHTEDDRYPPETNDNWISFTINEIEYKYEFSIETLEINNEFEKVIYDLRNKYNSFYYESI